MADTTQNYINVHGRAGLLIPYSRFITVDGEEVQVDISDFSIFIEIPAAHIRKALVANPQDSKGLRILLTRSEVETLPDRESPFVVIDETGDVPLVDWTGMIRRTGYKGDPSA